MKYLRQQILFCSGQKLLSFREASSTWNQKLLLTSVGWNFVIVCYLWISQLYVWNWKNTEGADFFRLSYNQQKLSKTEWRTYADKTPAWCSTNLTFIFCYISLLHAWKNNLEQNPDSTDNNGKASLTCWSPSSIYICCLIFVSKIKTGCHTLSISFLNHKNLSAWTVFWTQCNLKYFKCNFLLSSFYHLDLHTFQNGYIYIVFR